MEKGGAQIQWNEVDGIQVKRGDGTFYVDLGKLSERESIKGVGCRIREWRGAWLQEVCRVCQMRSVSITKKKAFLNKQGEVATLPI